MGDVVTMSTVNTLSPMSPFDHAPIILTGIHLRNDAVIEPHERCEFLNTPCDQPECPAL